MMRAWLSRQCLCWGMALCLLGISGCAALSPGGRSGSLSDRDVETFQRAMALLQAEDYHAGIALLTGITDNTRASAIPFINLAMAYSRIDELDKAEESLKVALEIEPRNPVAHNEYGLLLRRQGRFEEARQVYQNILQRYPDFALARKNLGVLCDIYLRDYECALKAYQAYSAVAPDDEEVRIWIADLEWRVEGT
ncbi:tetratricopeptide repeat protein [Isoalcanivorax indicus]|uniref:tetratricopeptide repeat protein n=1 Tax=Isoalcanivorax indicus TaxID=2202653 RepID=UPI000DBA238F|nr:tetratricopeptide repeat protein [Isoalcanivorax indicus]